MAVLLLAVLLLTAPPVGVGIALSVTLAAQFSLKSSVRNATQRASERAQSQPANTPASQNASQPERPLSLAFPPPFSCRRPSHCYSAALL